jgi:hypothetical protein
LRVDAKIEKIDYETIFSKQKNTLRKEHATWDLSNDIKIDGQEISSLVILLVNFCFPFLLVSTFRR